MKVYVCLAMLAATPVVAQIPSNSQDALVLGEGSVARRELVAVGRDLVVEGEAKSDVAVVRGNVTVVGRVAGDVIALAGDIRLEAGAEIDGNVQALGGHIDLQPGARVNGRIAAYPRLHASMLTLVDGPALGLGWWNPTLLLLKLGLAAAWVLWACLCAVFAPRTLRRTAIAFSAGPLRLFAVGLGVVFTAALLVVLLTVLLPLAAALPLLLLTTLLLLGLKLWGIAALSLALGRFLIGLRSPTVPLLLGPVVLGMIALNLFRFVPVLGIVSWAAFTLVAVGAAVHDRASSLEASRSAASG